MFIIWCLKWNVLVRYWHIAKIKVQNEIDKKAFIKKQESEGKKPYSFELGNIVIYAENSHRAALDYKKLKQETKTAIKNLKNPNYASISKRKKQN
ncbi:hypothetical protein BIW12_09255 [Flavobacterium commune]|uniref:Uncharacterized protein n=1 Tax=Flavobacterium commune TaxID=1306519 RepID=A0A1D9PAL5_9FLAO|nr:hypothetical protein BIW12_09255 [Flavobacterium commune]